MEQRPKWVIHLHPDGKIEIEGQGFVGDECINDVMYSLLKKAMIIEEEQRTSSFGDTRPVQNINYIRN